MGRHIEHCNSKHMEYWGIHYTYTVQRTTTWGIDMQRNGRDLLLL